MSKRLYDALSNFGKVEARVAEAEARATPPPGHGERLFSALQGFGQQEAAERQAEAEAGYRPGTRHLEALSRLERAQNAEANARANQQPQPSEPMSVQLLRRISQA